MTQSRRAFYREPPVSQTLASEQEGHSPGGAMLSPPHPTSPHPQDCHQGSSFSCTSRQPGAEAEVFLILAVLAGMK